MPSVSTRRIDSRFILDDPKDEDRQRLAPVPDEDEASKRDPGKQARLEGFLDLHLAPTQPGALIPAGQALVNRNETRA